MQRLGLFSSNRSTSDEIVMRLHLTHMYTQSLSIVTDAIVRVNKKADREYFIKTKGTGTTRPVDRV